MKDKKNSHFGNSYSTIESVLDTITEASLDNDIINVQTLEVRENKQTGDPYNEIITQLIHVPSDTRIVSEMLLTSKDPNDPQKIGSSITYYRRYALITVWGLAPEDDDGNMGAESGLQSLKRELMAQGAKDAQSALSKMAELGVPVPSDDFAKLTDKQIRDARNRLAQQAKEARINASKLGQF